ncbi:MAG: PKD domain-containing protein [Flavobacteriales bacterium]|nr:PKD domain-containing protein [Flavobacteriales bacterium]MDP4731273.1 PKD domain-containing protein [Flavobacteriales bacterium]
MKKIFFCAGLVCFANLLHAQTRVLFIGNSYTAVNNLPQLTADCALSIGFAGFPMEIASSTPGGTTFQVHTTNATSQSLINQGNWDYVVLQEQSQLPSFPDAQVAAECFPFAAALNEQILAADSCAETIFYMTWGRQNGDASNCASWPPVCTYEGMDSLLNLRYRQMAIDNQAILSPVGALWKYIRTNYPEINLYAADGSHPSLEGTYAAACSMVSVIFRTDPTLITYGSTLDPVVSEKIRIAAQAVVFNNLAEWHVGEYDPEILVNTTSNGLTLQLDNQSVSSWNFTWDFGDGNSSTDFSPQHTYANAGVYSLSYSAIDACGRTSQGYWEIQLLDNGVAELEKKYVVRNLENEYAIDFSSLASDIRIFDLNGRLIQISSNNHSSFYIAKSNSPRIIQFTMNGISHRILLGIE